MSAFTHSHPKSYNGGSAFLTKFRSNHSYMHWEQYLAQWCFKTKNGARNNTTDVSITGPPLCHGTSFHSFLWQLFLVLFYVSRSLYWVPVAQESRQLPFNQRLCGSVTEPLRSATQGQDTELQIAPRKHSHWWVSACVLSRRHLRWRCLSPACCKELRGVEINPSQFITYGMSYVIWPKMASLI